MQALQVALRGRDDHLGVLARRNGARTRRTPAPRLWRPFKVRSIASSEASPTIASTSAASIPLPAA
jgi:hypothetical protein